jgi:hypothetical protein
MSLLVHFLYFFAPLLPFVCAQLPVDCVKFFVFVLYFRRIAPIHPLRRHCQLCSGGYAGAFRCTGGISRANRQSFVSIQRFLPCFPPVISAGNLHKLQFMQLL